MSPIEVPDLPPAVSAAAWAVYEFQSDRSHCAYWRGEGTCSFGCTDEPECQTGTPSGGWPLQVVRKKYADLLPSEDMYLEPGEDEVVTALMVLEGLHADGWRIVRVASCSCGRPDVEHTDGVHHPDGNFDMGLVVDQWEPRS